MVVGDLIEGFITNIVCTTLHYTTLHYTTQHYNVLEEHITVFSFNLCTNCKGPFHSKSRLACLRHEHHRHACLGCLNINVFEQVSSISRHLPLTNCKQRLRSNNGE